MWTARAPSSKMNRMTTKVKVLFFLGAILTSPCPAQVLSVIDPRPRAQFEEQGLRALTERATAISKGAVVKNLTPYNDKGEFAPEQIQKALESAEPGVVVVQWNRVKGAGDEALIQAAQKVAGEKYLVVAAGVAPEGDGTHSLKRTLWGAVPEAFLIGELAEKEKLVERAFFGPEMLTALGPRDLEWGPGTAALSFGVRMLSLANSGSTPPTVLQQFREKRGKVRRLWPFLSDFFSSPTPRRRG